MTRAGPQQHRSLCDTTHHRPMMCAHTATDRGTSRVDRARCHCPATHRPQHTLRSARSQAGRRNGQPRTAGSERNAAVRGRRYAGRTASPGFGTSARSPFHTDELRNHPPSVRGDIGGNWISEGAGVPTERVQLISQNLAVAARHACSDCPRRTANGNRMSRRRVAGQTERRHAVFVEGDDLPVQDDRTPRDRF